MKSRSYKRILRLDQQKLVGIFVIVLFAVFAWKQPAFSSVYSIQNILNRINENISFLASNSTSGVKISDLPTSTIRMAIAVIGILPIVCIYPFFQEYFVRGIAVGAVKG